MAFTPVGPVHDPDVVLRVDADADRLAEDPVVRQRLGPERIHFEPRRLNGGLRADRSVERPLRDAERGQRGDEARADEQMCRLMTFLPPLRPVP